MQTMDLAPRPTSGPAAQVAAFVAFLVAVAVAGAIGSAATLPSIPTWYAGLVKPGFTPPNWLFPPAWTALYVLMAVSAWLVWRQGGRVPVRGPLAAWGIQLALNALWSVLFFGLHRPGLALVEILLLWAAVAWTLLSFRAVSRPAAWLLVPYLLWLSYAVALNAGVWLLN
ncbi:TspO/MBR family protein [Arenibaculum pallidiluteum]|uniref:TspO/MBR family protein n=1 Tax=Arenibaculum pallidiluteum TaxID=2812559 RepID=UPI001A9566F4|nr:TspO/MBR family protein [Arenibaculum pallidiluteum]